MDDLKERLNAFQATSPYDISTRKQHTDTILALAHDVVLDGESTHVAELRDVFHVLASAIGPSNSSLRNMTLKLVAHASEFEKDVLELVLDLVSLSFDDESIDKIAEGLILMCGEDITLILPVIKCLSPFPSYRRRCFDIAKDMPLLEVDFTEIVCFVLGLVRNKGEADIIVELIRGESPRLFDDFERILPETIMPLASALCDAREKPDVGEHISQAHRMHIHADDQGINFLDMIVLLKFPLAAEPLFQHGIENGMFPFKVMQQVLEMVPADHFKYDALRWAKFFLNNREKRIKLPKAFLMCLYQHYDGDKQDMLLCLLGISDEIISAQPAVYSFLLQLYRSEPTEMQSLWPVLSHKLTFTDPCQEEGNSGLLGYSARCICTLLAIMARDDNTFIPEVIAMAEALMVGIKCYVVRGIQLASCLASANVLGELTRPRIERLVVRILLPTRRLVIDPEIGLCGLKFLRTGKSDVFPIVKKIMTNMGIVRAQDAKKSQDPSGWMLGFEDLPISVKGRRITYSLRVIFEQVSAVSDERGFENLCVWVHSLLFEYLHLGSQQTSSWRPEGWLLAAIEVPALVLPRKRTKKMSEWACLDFSLFSPPPFEEHAVYVERYSRASDIHNLYEETRRFTIGLLIALALTTAVVKITLSKNDDKITTDDAIIQLFKLYTLEAKLEVLESFITSMIIALKPKSQQYHEKRNSCSSVESDLDAISRSVQDFDRLLLALDTTKEAIWVKSQFISDESIWKYLLCVSKSHEVALSSAMQSLDDRILRSIFLTCRLATHACGTLREEDEVLSEFPLAHVFELTLSLLHAVNKMKVNDKATPRDLHLLSIATRRCLQLVCQATSLGSALYGDAFLAQFFFEDRPNDAVEFLFEKLASAHQGWELSFVSESVIELLYSFSTFETGASLKLRTLELSWTSLCTHHHYLPGSELKSIPIPRVLNDAIAAFDKSGMKKLPRRDRLVSHTTLQHVLACCREVTSKEPQEISILRASILRHMGLILDCQKSGLNSTPHIQRMTIMMAKHFACSCAPALDGSVEDESLNEPFADEHENSDLSMSSLLECSNLLLQILWGLVLVLMLTDVRSPPRLTSISPIFRGFAETVKLFIQHDEVLSKKTKASLEDLCLYMLRTTMTKVRYLDAGANDAETQLLHTFSEQVNSLVYVSIDNLLSCWEKSDEAAARRKVHSRRRSLHVVLKEARHELEGFASSWDGDVSSLSQPQNEEGPERPEELSSENNGRESDDDDSDVSFGAAGNWGGNSSDGSTESSASLNLEATMVIRE